MSRCASGSAPAKSVTRCCPPSAWLSPASPRSSQRSPTSPSASSRRKPRGPWPRSGATVAVPLGVGGRSLGALAVGYSHGRVLTPEEERLLSMFADQAALALESARVRGESEQRRREAEALALVAQRLTETLDVEEVG